MCQYYPCRNIENSIFIPDITLNPNKFYFAREDIDFVGYKIGKSKLDSLDSKKIEALSNFLCQPA